MRQHVIKIAEFMAFIVLLPFFIWSKLPFSEYSCFTASSQILSLIPGLLGVLLRRVWYCNTLKRCGKNLTVDWLGVIRTRQSEIGNNCTVGVGSWINWVRLGNDVIIANNVTILSGGKHHGFADVNIPMRKQEGQKMQVCIGDDVWIGAGSIILSHVSNGTVIGSGSVVTHAYAEFSVLVGVPAHPIKNRKTDGVSLIG